MSALHVPWSFDSTVVRVLNDVVPHGMLETVAFADCAGVTVPVSVVGDPYTTSGGWAAALTDVGEGPASAAGTATKAAKTSVFFTLFLYPGVTTS